MGADVEVRPARMQEVRRTLSAQHLRRTGGTRSIQTHSDHVSRRNSRGLERDVQPVRNLSETDIGPLSGKGRMLTQTLDQKSLVCRYDGIVNGGPAKINSGDDLQSELPGADCP